MLNHKCNQCPRKCNAERLSNENNGGFCRMPASPVVARAALHFGEEPCISGEKGSGTIFFSGCNLKCVFCQNYEISTLGNGEQISVERLAEIMRELENKGAHNINFVNPSHYFSTIEEALSIYKPNIPLVYNSSGYDFAENINKNIFDIYLFDLKYASSDRALKYSGAADYFDVATNAIKNAYANVSECVFNENGIMQKGIIVRHLLMPLATKEAISVINWFNDNIPNAYFSLMSQFTPCGKCSDYPEINRRITKREYNKVCDYLFEKDLNNVYLQELSSATTDYIPIFNGFGVKKP